MKEQHFSTRLQERFGIRFTEEVRKEIRTIMNSNPIKRGRVKYSHGLSRYIIEYQGKQMNIIFNRDSNTLVTVTEVSPLNQ